MTEVALAFPLGADMKTVTLAKVNTFNVPRVAFQKTHSYITPASLLVFHYHSAHHPSSPSECSALLSLPQDLQQQQVFAFLPLRSYGFRFIVQGDFDLPSSREDVNSDSVWNQFLRDEIPHLFLHALDKMKVCVW